MSTRRIPRREIVLSGVVVLVLGWWFLFSGQFFASHRRNAPQREAMRQLHTEIPLGATRAEVEDAFQKHRTPKLTLLTNDVRTWRIRMPPELGARDWWLLIEFRAEGVSALRVRTSDGPPPPDGPADREN